MKTSEKKIAKPKSKFNKKTSDTVKDGVEDGQYSKSTWNNGELISFDIDWDKLSSIVRSLDEKNLQK